MKCFPLILILVFASFSMNAQSDTAKPDSGVFFADIHTYFQHDLNGNNNPQSAFGLTTAIMGYKKSFSQKVSGIILYDVTRTTNFSYPDTIGINGYFEGSKYTAFLKMAEIDWKFSNWGEIGFGQLLNEQYLTVQDKHWGMRYVATTMQELFRFGMPADFGLRVKLRPIETLILSFTAVNGEGPFKYQDNESNFLYSANVEYSPKDYLIFKLYADYEQHASTLSENRSTISGFVGFKTKKWMAGAEYNMVFNNSFVPESDLSGASVYGSMKVGAKTAVFVRVDYMQEYGNVKSEAFLLAGAEYRPTPNLGFSVNLKRNTWLNTSMICLNAGIRF